MNSWKDMLEARNGGGEGSPPAGLPDDAGEPDLAPLPDPAVYRPWILQRGNGRPALFLDFRWFDAKAGFLNGCQVSYPHLVAVDYFGDKMVALDFGNRKFIVEGTGLAELPRWLQQGYVLAIQEYSAAVWGEKPAGPVVTRIVRMEEAPPQGDRPAKSDV